MSKIAIWLTTGMLLIYIPFVSGFFYWVSGCEVTDKLITPFSWALSAKEMGLTPIATKGDVDCIRWLVDESKQDLVIVGDTNSVCLLEGHIQYWANPARDRIRDIKDIFSLDRCYLFLTDRSIRYGEYTYCTDIGLRKHYAFDISDNGDGCLTYVADVPQRDGTIVTKTTLIKEVYKSGNARVYEKVNNQTDE